MAGPRRTDPPIPDLVAKLTTTSIYTQVSIDRLKKVHEATHPGARLKRASETEQEKKG